MMGQHTWFHKSAADWDEMGKIDDRLSRHYEGTELLADSEVADLESRGQSLYDSSHTDYHDLFRTSKRDSEGYYTDETIRSLDDTMKWLIDNAATVSMRDPAWSIPQIRKFWNEYPGGIITFG